MIINPKMNEENVTFPMFSGPRAGFSKMCLVLPNTPLGLKGTQPAQMYKVGFVPVYLETKYINQLQIEGHCWMPFKQDPDRLYWVLPLKRQLFGRIPFYSNPDDILAEAESLFPGITAIIDKAGIAWKAQIANVLCGPIKSGFHYCYRIVLCNAHWDILTGTPFAAKHDVSAQPNPDEIEWSHPVIAAAQTMQYLPMWRHEWSWFSDDVTTVAAAETLAKELSKIHPDLCVAFGRQVPEAYPGIPKSKLYVRYFVGGKAYKEMPATLNDLTK